MRNILTVGLVLVAIVIVGLIGVGFYRAWFSFTADTAAKNSNVTFSVDADKFQADRKSAVEGAQDLGRRIKDQVSGTGGTSMDGTVVSVAGDKLIMTNQEGKEHAHTLAADIQVTCDGKECKAADLKSGMRIRVTTNAAVPHAASRIEALDKAAAFAGSSQDGKLVSVTGDKLVMTDMDGKASHTRTLTADAKITCDGQLCKASDLKAGMRIRVTTTKGEPDAATQIEALDKNQDFARVS